MRQCSDHTPAHPGLCWARCYKHKFCSGFAFTRSHQGSMFSSWCWQDACEGVAKRRVPHSMLSTFSWSQRAESLSSFSSRLSAVLAGADTVAPKAQDTNKDCQPRSPVSSCKGVPAILIVRDSKSAEPLFPCLVKFICYFGWCRHRCP